MTRKIVLLLIIGVLFLPFLPLLIWSFAQGWYFPQLVPDWTLQNWSDLLTTSTKVGQGFGQSLVIAATSTGLALLVGLPAGRALGLRNFPGKGAIKLFLLLPIIVSPLATLMGIQFILIRLGLSGTIIGVVLVHLLPTIPYMTLVLSSVYANFDPDYEIQARSLGASPIQVLQQITLPLIAPGVVVGALFAFLISWNEFLLTFFVGSGRVFTLPMVLFTALQGGNTGLSSAIAITSLLPALIFLLFSSRALNDDAAIGGLGNV
ncbi:MAG: putative spermidine/putrescine transport system permease protein [Phormidesmis priestleyi Ana]|uniref:Putative spermidine/putrescine transport system permease protein n=1 Tax=Phormidesmis priestleyi Ana TaxID=1666911 RepID=A0A0P7YTL9_9CYAN|nr:MAG: putative spermidine/putrescine transport system permease protein [Phormidesmis priestleyi Ana]